MGTTTLLTFEQFERLPDRPGKTELLEGELICMPPAELEHMEIAERLYLRLLAAVRVFLQTHADVQFGKVHHEMGYRLTTDPRSWLQPDVSLTHPNQHRGKYYEGSPFIAFEVLSESNRPAQMDRKIRLFLKHGAREVWVFDPETRDAKVYRADSDSPRHETLAFQTDLLPAEIHIPLSQIFED